jgi:hypothetical protein
VLSPTLLCSALPPAVLPLRPPLCRPSPSTSCFLFLHASASSSPGPVPLPCWPPARAPRLPRASAGCHLLVTMESSPQSLNSLSLARNSTTLTSTSRSSRAFVNSRAPDPRSTAASLLLLRQRTASPCNHHRASSAPINPRASFPVAHSCSRPPSTFQLQSELRLRRAPPSLPSASPWAARFEHSHTPTTP